MSRIPLLPEDGLSAEQRVVYDKMTAGPRGVVVGPMRAALHSPELADRWQSLGEFLRYRSVLDPRISELAILICGRYWNSAVEWYVHAEVGLRVGLAKSTLAAIRSAVSPVLERGDEAVVYEYTRQLLQNGRVGEIEYQAAYRTLGKVGIVELTALVGYYTMVAMTLNAHDVPLPPEADPDVFRTLDDAAAPEDGAPTILPQASDALAVSAQRKA